MAANDKVLVLGLAEGVTEGVAEEIANGVMTVSENTRLSKLTGSVTRRPLETLVKSVTAGSTCGGLIVGGQRSVAAYFKPYVGVKRVFDDSAEDVLSSVASTAGQNAYFPYPMTQSGVIPGSSVLNAPATVYDSEERQWFAAVRYLAGSFGVFVNVVNAGANQVASRVVAPLTTTLPAGIVLWCGLVRSTNGVVLFYAQDAGIYARTLAIDTDGIGLIVGAQTFIYNPLKSGFYHQADVVSDDNNTAWLLTRDAAGTTSVRFSIVDLTTLAVSSFLSVASVISNHNSGKYFALSYRNGKLAYYTSDNTAYGTFGVRDSSTLTLSWSAVTFFEYGPVAVQPHVQDTNDCFIFASQMSEATIASAPTQVSFRRYTVGGSAAGVSSLFWYALCSRGAYHQTSIAEVYPYFPCTPCWSIFSNNVFPTPRTSLTTPSERVIDPSVEVFTPFTYGPSEFLMTCMARCGVDRAAIPIRPMGNANSAAVSPLGKFGLTYVEYRYDQSYIAQNGYAARYVEIDLNPAQQPGSASDYGVVSMIAAALPACWDGTETTEAAFLHTPRVIVDATGGTGAALTGTFLVTAVITFRDAAGNLHRSAPALPFPVTLAATSPRVYVTMPTTMRSGVRQEEFDIVLYWTLSTGTIFYAHPASVTSRGANGGMWRFDDIAAPNDADVPLYSDGTGIQELLPQCPPPARDIAAIGGRFWLIDAEDPYSAWPSKLKKEGFAIEFAGQLRITGFDQQYGKLVSVVDVGGIPHFLAERGIWQVTGYGPDNNGKGGRFNDPRLVSNQGCKSRASVIVIPETGVMYQAQDGKMVLLSGGGVKRFENFGPYDVRAPSIHFAESEVIYPRADGGGFIVYNWIADGWTHWPSAVTRDITATATVQLGGTQQTLLYTQATGQLLSMKSDSVDYGEDAGSPIVLERGWIAPESPQGHCVIGEVWLHAKNVGAHALNITVYCDYDQSGVTVNGHTNYKAGDWSAAQLTPLTKDGKYTVRVLLRKPARAVKVRVTATPSGGVEECFHPLSLTVLYGTGPGLSQRTLPDGATR